MRPTDFRQKSSFSSKIVSVFNLVNPVLLLNNFSYNPVLQTHVSLLRWAITACSHASQSVLSIKTEIILYTLRNLALQPQNGPKLSPLTTQ
jgi:hypothetical protein